jgi:hypothetical protein
LRHRFRLSSLAADNQPGFKKTIPALSAQGNIRAKNNFLAEHAAPKISQDRPVAVAVIKVKALVR